MSLIGPRPYFADELEDQQKVSQTKELVKKLCRSAPELPVSGKYQAVVQLILTNGLTWMPTMLRI